MSIARSVMMVLSVACGLLTSGCISTRLEMGRPVDPRMVTSALRTGESTRADVLALLGEPNGKGRSLLPIDTAPRTVWSYYYEESTIESNALTDSRRTFLWVYFDGDRYDGYLWFSSLPAVQQP